MSLFMTNKNIGRPIPPMDAAAPTKTETATLALGCFWGPDALYGCTPGVVRTRVGYSGGKQPNPTYYNIGDHTESVQIEFDPEIISYERILDIFWHNHNPKKPGWLRQYMSILFFHDKKQQRTARDAFDREASRIKEPIYTELKPFTKFYIAESYHQKYHLRQYSDLIGEYHLIYSVDADFVSSTSAAKVNGYVTGYGTIENFNRDIDSLGLSPEGIRSLTDIFNRFQNR